MASGDFRYLLTVFREMSNSLAISRIPYPAPFSSYISFTSATFSNAPVHLRENYADDDTYLRWVNSNLLFAVYAQFRVAGDTTQGCEHHITGRVWDFPLAPARRIGLLQVAAGYGKRLSLGSPAPARRDRIDKSYPQRATSASDPPLHAWPWGEPRGSSGRAYLW